jgi:hypothetical protein
MEKLYYIGLLKYFIVSALCYIITFLVLTTFKSNIAKTGLAGIAVQSVVILQVFKIFALVLGSFLYNLSEIFILAIYIYIVCGAIYCGFKFHQIKKSKQNQLVFIRMILVDVLKKIFRSDLFIKISVIFCISFIALFLSVSFLRGFYFIDTTYDCETYNIPKIAFYLQNQSIFFSSGSPDFRIDTLERNAELNFLSNLLITGSPRIIGLTGIEVWLSMLLGAYALCRVAGALPHESLLASLLVCSAPVVFGMTGVTKGDALVVSFILYAAYFLILLIKGMNPPFGIFFLLVSLALACGTKMTSSFAVIGIVILLLAHWKKWKIPHFCELSITIICCFFASSKAIQNIILYRNPFPKPQWVEEVSGFSINNFFAGLQGAWQWLFPTGSKLSLSGYSNDMEKTMGLTIYVLALIFIFMFFYILSRRLSSPITKVTPNYFTINSQFISVFILSGIMLFAFIDTTHVGFEGNWTRYLLPYAVSISAVLFAIVIPKCRENKWAQISLLFISMLSVFFNAFQATRPSTVFTMPGRKAIAEQILAVESHPRNGFNNGMVSIYDALSKYEKRVKSIALVQLDLDIPIVPAFGSQFEWMVNLCSALDCSKIQNSEVEMVYVTTRNPKEIVGKMAYVNSNYYPIWAANNTAVFIRNTY